MSKSAKNHLEIIRRYLSIICNNQLKKNINKKALYAQTNWFLNTLYRHRTNIIARAHYNSKTTIVFQFGYIFIRVLLFYDPFRDHFLNNTTYSINPPQFTNKPKPEHKCKAAPGSINPGTATKLHSQQSPKCNYCFIKRKTP